MVTITFLGTAATQPTKERNVSGILLTYENENIMIDCGEGTQRQMRIKGLKNTKITKILLTHFHGDHVLGLGGLIRTLGSSAYDKTLEVYGPKDSKKYFSNLMNSSIFNEKVDVKVTELNKGIFFKSDKFRLECIPLNHSAPCLGYSFIEEDKRKINLDYLKKFGLAQHPLLGELQKGRDIEYKGKIIKASKATTLVPGKKVTFLIDTGLCKEAVELAKNSDLLVCEATFAESEKEMAREVKHLTAKQAAKIAKKSKVKKLVLTHFSQRYKTTDQILKEAKSIFKNVECAKDLMEVKI